MRNAATPLALVLLLVCACGGGGAASEPAKGPIATTTKDTAPAKATDEQEAPSGPRKPSCADGSCFSCGDSICPIGFYCETARAGAGCAWASTCTDKPTCACLGAAVKGCECQDDGGVARVTCR